MGLALKKKTKPLGVQLKETATIAETTAAEEVKLLQSA